MVWIMETIAKIPLSQLIPLSPFSSSFVCHISSCGRFIHVRGKNNQLSVQASQAQVSAGASYVHDEKTD